MKNYIKIFLLSLKTFILCFTFLQCSEDYIEGSEKGIIKGIVVKHNTNEPLANVKISTAPTTSTIFTASDGSFEIKDVPIGDYSVKAELQGYIMEVQGANIVEFGQNVSLVFEMKDDNALNSPPSVPVLLTPADNSTDLGLDVNVTWNCTDSDDDEITYKVILKKNKNSDFLEF